MIDHDHDDHEFVACLSIDMAPHLERHLRRPEVTNQVDPNIRRLNRLIAVGLEIGDHDLAVWAWLLSLLKARGNRHGLALQAALRDRRVRRELAAAMLEREQDRGVAGPSPATGEGVDDA
jgi:hypothetical protein